MEVKRNGSRPSNKGAVESFTGQVTVEPLFETKPPGRVQGVSVSFEPGARSAWHSHPLGQTLIVTSGHGLVEEWGGPVEEISSGDLVTCAAGQKHWHGASPTNAMTHIAIQEALGGKAVEWLEKVSDEHYRESARTKHK